MRINEVSDFHTHEALDRWLIRSDVVRIWVSGIVRDWMNLRVEHTQEVLRGQMGVRLKTGICTKNLADVTIKTSAYSHWKPKKPVLHHAVGRRKNVGSHDTGNHYRKMQRFQSKGKLCVHASVQRHHIPYDPKRKKKKVNKHHYIKVGGERPYSPSESTPDPNISCSSLLDSLPSCEEKTSRVEVVQARACTSSSRSSSSLDFLCGVDWKQYAADTRASFSADTSEIRGFLSTRTILKFWLAISWTYDQAKRRVSILLVYS